MARAFARRGIYTEVYPGIELCEALLDASIKEDFGERGITFAIIGGREGVADEAQDYLISRHKNTKCLFTFCGFGFSEEEVRRTLSEQTPDILLVCLGSPKQELLISRLRSYSPNTLYIGLGGSLDVFSGRVKRAPAPLRKIGLEWLWRMLREPKRLAKIPTLFDFLWLVKLEGNREN